MCIVLNISSQVCHDAEYCTTRGLGGVPGTVHIRGVHKTPSRMIPSYKSRPLLDKTRQNTFILEVPPADLLSSPLSLKQRSPHVAFEHDKLRVHLVDGGQQLLFHALHQHAQDFVHFLGAEPKDIAVACLVPREVLVTRRLLCCYSSSSSGEAVAPPIRNNREWCARIRESYWPVPSGGVLRICPS